MSTLARTATGDLAIHLRIERDLPTLTRQKVTDQFGLWLGEWFLNTTIGFPWLQRVLGLKAPNLTQIRALFRQAILEAPAVVAVHEVQLRLDHSTRSLAYGFTATLNTGETLVGGSGQPFVVTGGGA